MSIIVRRLVGTLAMLCGAAAVIGWGHQRLHERAIRPDRQRAEEQEARRVQASRV